MGSFAGRFWSLHGPRLRSPLGCERYIEYMQHREVCVGLKISRFLERGFSRDRFSSQNESSFPTEAQILRIDLLEMVRRAKEPELLQED